MTRPKKVTAFAPASIGNVAVGYDMLGLAIEGAGDHVTASRSNGAGIHVKQILDPDGNEHQTLDKQTDRNTAAIAARALWDAVNPGGGLELVVRKGIPLQSGMGSSAASAVAGAVAANALLDEPFDLPEVLPFALEGEKYASNGLHADNVAPSLLGGLVLCPATALPKVVQLAVPDALSSVLLHVDLQVNTAESRSRLRADVSVEQWLMQQGYLATFIAGCTQNDAELIGISLRDVIIEPQRAAAVPCFPAVKSAALNAGALGCSLSGSGPSIFCLCDSAKAESIAAKMVSTCHDAGFECRSYVSSLHAPGASVETH